jgi:hypothetical protein
MPQTNTSGGWGVVPDKGGRNVAATAGVCLFPEPTHRGEVMNAPHHQLVISVALACLAAACASTPVEPEIEEVLEMIPLDLMGTHQRYHGLAGGLVDNGSPTVTPVDGRIVIIAISMSNGFMEMTRFIELYDDHAAIHPQIGLVNCAKGGNALERWLSVPSLWTECRQKIAAAGFRDDQVRVVWAKDANQFTDHLRTLPHPDADYYDLVDNVASDRGEAERGGVYVRRDRSKQPRNSRNL